MRGGERLTLAWVPKDGGGMLPRPLVPARVGGELAAHASAVPKPRPSLTQNRCNLCRQVIERNRALPGNKGKGMSKAAIKTATGLPTAMVDQALANSE